MKGLINDIASRLLAAYPEDEARALAWWIAEEETGMNRTQLLTGCKDTAFSPHMQEVVARLLHFEPVQYIFGHTLWDGLDLKVTPATLIPRPETAELVATVNEEMRICENEKIEKYENEKMLKCLDIGTGSGCIAIAIKKAHPQWQVTGIDISAEAVAVARENARRNGVEVDFRQTDIFSDETVKNLCPDGTCFDIVVSNPPYICESEKTSMKPNVLDYEPGGALFVPDNDPLLFYRRIAALRLGTHLFFEINEAYAQETAALLRTQGYTSIRILRDTYTKPRFAACRMDESIVRMKAY